MAHTILSQARIDDLTAELEKEMQTKRMMQDNLKRVFMRGVCALNLEAMSLLGKVATKACGLLASLDDMVSCPLSGGQPSNESEAEEQFNRLFGSPSATTFTNPMGSESRPQVACELLIVESPGCNSG